jgi:hypothetical protein
VVLEAQVPDVVAAYNQALTRVFVSLSSTRTLYSENLRLMMVVYWGGSFSTFGCGELGARVDEFEDEEKGRRGCEGWGSLKLCRRQMDENG